MKEQQVVFYCDHIVNILRRESVVFSVVRSSVSSIDEITSSGSVPHIYYVYQWREDGVEHFVQNKDYVLEDNGVSWISDHQPAQGSLYLVEAMCSFREIRDYTETPELCERCFGNGWYVNPLDTTYRKCEATTGLVKLVQNFIKIVYTRAQDSYGTNLTDMAGQAIADPDIFLSDITTELQSAALQLQKIQESMMQTSMEYVDPKEILSEMQILETDYDKQEEAAYVSLRLLSTDPDKSVVLNFRF